MCRRAAHARSTSTAMAAARTAAPTAMRAICQPGMPPACTTCTWAGAGGGCLSVPGSGGSVANAADAVTMDATTAPASPASMTARRRMVRMGFMTTSLRFLVPEMTSYRQRARPRGGCRSPGRQLRCQPADTSLPANRPSAADCLTVMARSCTSTQPRRSNPRNAAFTLCRVPPTWCASSCWLRPSRILPSSPGGWLSSTFARRRGKSRKTRSDAASVSRRRLAATELISACAADGTRAQMSRIVSRGTKSSWHASNVSASADLGPPSAILSSPNTPPGSMIASVSSPPSAERTTTLTRPEMTTAWPRRKTRNRLVAMTAFRSSPGTERSRLVWRKMPVTSVVIADSPPGGTFTGTQACPPPALRVGEFLPSAHSSARHPWAPPHGTWPEYPVASVPGERLNGPHRGGWRVASRPRTSPRADMPAHNARGAYQWRYRPCQQLNGELWPADHGLYCLLRMHLWGCSYISRMVVRRHRRNAREMQMGRATMPLGGVCGHVPPGRPCPVQGHRDGGGQDRGADRDEGDLPAGHAPRDDGVSDDRRC